MTMIYTQLLLAFCISIVGAHTVEAAGLAQQGGASGTQLGTLLANVSIFIDNVLIPALLAIAFVVFVWGVFRFFIAGGANQEDQEKAKSLMLYSIAGFVLILIFWGIVNLLASSTGLQGKALENVPQPVQTVQPGG